MAAKKHDENSMWDRLAERPGPNPCWFHPFLAWLWTGLVGAYVELAGHYPWMVVAAVGAATTPIAFFGARRLVAGEHEAFEAPRGQAGRVAAGAWLMMTGWAAWSATHHVLAPVSWPALGALTFGTALVGVFYTHQRCTLEEAKEFVEKQEQLAVTKADPAAPASSAAGAAGVSERTPLEQVWQTIYRRAGFGNVTCSITDTWIGYDVHTDLDPARADGFKTVRAALSRISGVAARELRAYGTPITDTALRIRNIGRDDAVVTTVRMRNVLTEKLRFPDEDEPTSINEPMEVGRWESGAPMLLHLPFKHGLTAGRTRSGKSNFAFSVIRRGTQCIDYLPIVLGVDKTLEMVGPLLQPLADGRCDRPIIDWVGGEDWDEFSRALRFLWALCKVRSGAPRGTYRRVDNQIVPANDQPLVHAWFEESDQVLRDPRLIQLPGARPQPAGSIIHYLTSKGAGLGISVDLLNQGVTEAEMGPYAGAIKRNTERRVVLNTMKKAHGDWALPDGANVDSSTLHHKDLFGAFETGAEVLHGKAYYQDTETEIPDMVVRHAEYVTRLEDYAVEKLRGLIGDDYDNRWSYSRTKGLREYFNGQFPYADDAAAPAGNTGTRPRVRTSSQRGVPTERDGQRGWQVGTWFVPDISSRGQRGDTESPVSAEQEDNGGDDFGDIPEEWRVTFESVRGLDTVEPQRPARHPVPEPLATVVAKLAGEAREFVSSAELAQLVGIDSERLGRTLTSQGVSSQKRGGERGRLVVEIRAAAEAWRRGQPPTAAAEEQ